MSMFKNYNPNNLSLSHGRSARPRACEFCREKKYKCDRNDSEGVYKCLQCINRDLECKIRDRKAPYVTASRGTSVTGIQSDEVLLEQEGDLQGGSLTIESSPSKASASPDINAGVSRSIGMNKLYWQQLIGKKGQNKRLLEEHHKVELTADLKEDEVWVTVVGYEEGVDSAERELQELVEFQKLFSATVCHPEPLSDEDSDEELESP